MEIAIDRLEEIVHHSRYAVNGDDNEKKYEKYVSNLFLNLETFWRQFVVPFTNRIDDSIAANKPNKIKPRQNIAIEIQEIGCFHYSVFLNLSYAHKVFESKHDSFFENYYTHLGSVCDSTEEFLIKIYFLILDCTATETEVLQKLSKKKFLEIAKHWYDSNYQNAYTHYLSKGKPPPIKLIGRNYVLDEYFGQFEYWKKYKSFTQKIKEYRNVIVHNYQIASIYDNHGKFYVPKKERIHDYKKWNQVFNAITNPQKFHSQFIERETQMKLDIEEFKEILNQVWTRPIQDMNKLLYIERNRKLLKKYDLVLL